MILEAALTVAMAGGPVRDRPPECVPVTIVAAQSNGTERRLRFDFCGFGAGADSPMHDSAAHATLILDGGGLPGRDCGTRAAPCVVFGP